MNGEDNMKTSLKKIANGILAITMMITLFTGVSFASTPLQDGEYTISVQAVSATTGEPSMANDSITKPVKLEVNHSKIYVILEMADSMYDLAVENSAGAFDLAEELLENTVAKTFTYKFPVKSIDEPVLMEMIVAAMGRKVNFKIKFDKASLVDVTTKSSTPAETTTNTATTVSNTDTIVSNPKTGDNTLVYLFNVILFGIGLSIITYRRYRMKERKTVKN